MMKSKFKLISLLTIPFIYVGCGSTYVNINGYKNNNLPLNEIKDANIIVSGTDTYKHNIRTMFPIKFKEKFYFNENINSNYNLFIDEINKYNKDNLSNSTYINTINYENKKYDVEYQESCLTTTYYLESNIKLEKSSSILLNKNFLSSKLHKVCRNNKNEKTHNFIERLKYKSSIHNFYYTPSFINEEIYFDKYVYDHYYIDLIKDTKKKIEIYLIPQFIKSNILILDELDVELSDSDKEIFEELLNSSFKYDAINKKRLNYLTNKYKNSHVLHYNTGLFYEQVKLYNEALSFYEKANNLLSSPKTTKRINFIYDQIRFLANFEK